MTARILVVAIFPADVRLLEMRLLAEYFEVITAANGAEAIATCETGKIDVVLLDVMLPDMDGFEVCRRLKIDPATSHIPVVMMTALGHVSDRIRGLEAGADEFLSKPVNDLQLMTRVRSLVRLKMLTDELRLRAATTRSIGSEELLARHKQPGAAKPQVLLIDEQSEPGKHVAEILEATARLDVATDPRVGLVQAVEGSYECIIVSTRFADFDPLRLCSLLRSLDRTRLVPIILLAGAGDDDRVVRGLEIGINDFLVRPADQQELTARLRTQVRRKRYNEELRSSVNRTIEMAATDGLTGLHNRRYFDTHLATLFDRAIALRRPLSVIIADVDLLKAVNDSFGHDAGGDVLRECAHRLRKHVRSIDLACVFGADEFVVVMPDTDSIEAAILAEGIRARIAQMPFVVGQECVTIEVTVSIGVSSRLSGADTVARLVKRADVALYQAKSGGRNRVIVRAAD